MPFNATKINVNKTKQRDNTTKHRDKNENSMKILNWVTVRILPVSDVQKRATNHNFSTISDTRKHK